MDVGAIRAARAIGLRVPQDLSVVGFDDLYWTTFLDPPLTTVRWPREETAHAATRLLMECLQPAAAADTPKRPLHVVIQPTLIVRSTTAPRADISARPTKTAS